MVQAQSAAIPANEMPTPMSVKWVPKGEEWAAIRPTNLKLVPLGRRRGPVRFRRLRPALVEQAVGSRVQGFAGELAGVQVGLELADRLRRRCPRGTRRVSAGRPDRKSGRPRSASFPSLNARAGLPLPQGCAAALQREKGAPRVSCRPVRKFQNPPPDGGGRAGDRVVGGLDLGNRPEEDLRPARRPGRRAGGGRHPC